MFLSLEVVSPNGSALGASRRKVFGAEGGRIGRSPDCDWVLASPYVSRHHATVHYASGSFFIESMGENGLAVGNPETMLPQAQRHRLSDGDRLFIDEFEVTVGVSSMRPGAYPAAGRAPGPTPNLLDDPFADPATRSAPLPDPLAPSADELDPLKQLTGRNTNPLPPRTEAPRDPAWNHSSSLADHFRPPPVPSGSGLPPTGSAIPDDWDRTSFGRTKFNQPPPGAAPPAAGAGGSGIPDDWDKTGFKAPPQVPQPSPPPRVNVTIDTSARMPAAPNRPPPQRAPQAPPPPSPAVRPGPAPARPVQSAPPPPPAPSTSASGVYRAPPVPPAPTPPATGSSFDLDTFLRSAGVDPANVPPDIASAMGNILRSVVQGVIEVLHARTEIKTQFRLPVTRVKSAENNPLKFSVNAEDALNSLLGKRNPAYMPALHAFDDAFEDIRFHQLAMLAGMRAGFESLLTRFDPTQLQELFDKQIKRGGLLSLGGKTKYWELYTELFGELAADRDDSFRRLFGEEFARAYEEQLERLKRSRATAKR